MLTKSPLNTFVLATDSADSGNQIKLLEITQSVLSRQESGMFLALAQSVTGQEDYSFKLDIQQTVNGVVSGNLLSIGQSVIGEVPFAPMHGEHSIGFDGENYTIRVFIGGIEINPCKLLKSCEISYTENEASTATLHIKEQCGAVDLYRYYNQIIKIYAQNNRFIYPLFDGIVDIPDIDFFSYSKTLTATNDRNGAIEKMSDEALNKIGYWCESVFGEAANYETRNAQLTDRLSTIPASFDFDANGQAVLTSWLPKEKPDWTLHDCDCYARNSSFKLSPATSLINNIEVTVYHQYDRLFHREIAYSYLYNNYVNDFDFVVNVPHEGPAPTFNDVYNAANGAGWLVGNFRSKGTPRSGWYGNIYFNGAEYEYEYEPTGSVDANGHAIVNVIQVAKNSLHDLYAMSASWTAMKRWRQAVEEKYNMVIQNTPSIQLHGMKTEKVTYTIRQDPEKSKLAKNWGNEKKYLRPKGTQQRNGDFTINVDDIIPNEYARAMEVIYQVSYTKILESHRNNEVGLCVKFAPKISLSDTIGIDTCRYVGNVKVKSYTHKLDFLTLLGSTELVGANFLNPASKKRDLSLPPLPPYRPTLPLAEYARSVQLRDYVVAFKQKIVEDDPNADKNPDDIIEDDSQNNGSIGISLGEQAFKLYECNGYVRVETGYEYYGHKVKRGYAFRVVTPDIEQQSTDTAELEITEYPIEVNVPHNPVKLIMEC